MISSNQYMAQASQYRLESSQNTLKTSQDLAIEYLQELQEAHISTRSSQIRLEAVSERLESGQTRIEEQLRAILASQHRSETPAVSHSLDASSPEGRETWMNLGRLLRMEGTTPMMIKENRDVLVKAMKSTLQSDHSSGILESYHTAFESFPDNEVGFGTSQTDHKHSNNTQSSKHSSINLLGSAPPLGATFADELLARHKDRVEPLDNRDNVKDGMQSLLQGMSTIDIDPGPEEDRGLDDMFVDDLKAAHEKQCPGCAMCAPLEI